VEPAHEFGLAGFRSLWIEWDPLGAENNVPREESIHMRVKHAVYANAVWWKETRTALRVPLIEVDSDFERIADIGTRRCIVDHWQRVEVAVIGKLAHRSDAMCHARCLDVRQLNPLRMVWHRLDIQGVAEEA